MSAAEDKRKHLDFIQLTITRMAANSFLLKAWGVTLVAALFTLAEKDTNKKYWMVAYVPAIAFWILDGYYLRQEKLYRELYNHVRKTLPEKIDFSLNAKPYSKRVDSWFMCMFSWTLLIFYGTVIGVLIIIMILTY